MKIRCNLCVSCKSGFCTHTAKHKKGKPVKITANKRRNCNHFELNEEEAIRILSKPKPQTFMRPEDYWLDRTQRRRLRKEYEEEIKNTYISQFSSTAEREDTSKAEDNKGVNDDERLF